MTICEKSTANEGRASTKAVRQACGKDVGGTARRSLWLERKREGGEGEDEVKERSGKGEIA